LAAQRILISVGPTQEPIDPARYIGNRSSGKMGMALVHAARRRGATVTVVMGPIDHVAPAGVAVVPVSTAEQMRAAVVEFADAADVVIMAAAVADYRPKTVATDKLKRSAIGRAMELSLVANPDILAEPPRQVALAGAGRLCRGDQQPGRQRRRQAGQQAL
jgi:phosphopantothenoylcysteine decarboxylase / phosphopantothenate---cysteine ligase